MKLLHKPQWWTWEATVLAGVMLGGILAAVIYVLVHDPGPSNAVQFASSMQDKGIAASPVTQGNVTLLVNNNSWFCTRGIIPEAASVHVEGWTCVEYDAPDYADASSFATQVKGTVQGK